MLRLTEFYTTGAPEGDLPGAVSRSTIGPGLIDEGYARQVFGEDFDRAVALGVLIQEEDPCPA